MEDDGHTPHLGVASIKVLASGSAGNCSVLVYHSPTGPRCLLIDAGIPVRRARRLLQESRILPDQIDGILLTHLDHDHWNPAWTRHLPAGAAVHLHHRHAVSARAAGVSDQALRPFDAEFDLWPGVRAAPLRGPHDDAGVVSYRIDFWNGDATASLGLATDIGRASEALIAHFRGVNVLAIESNYCPDLQRRSGRPYFLQQRITGGYGHLSNQQCIAAVESIAPRDHVILLHLSRECNDPELVASMHAGADYAVTIAAQDAPTRWVHVRAASRAVAAGVQIPLFTAAPRNKPLHA